MLIRRCFIDEEVEYKVYGGQSKFNKNKIIRSGHHAYEKCLKAFAFIEFQRAEHANEVRKDICGNDDGEHKEWKGRRIPVHPAVRQEWHERQAQ